ncbi:glycosyltransferase family 2 protein [Klenkia terrae]|uniref:glycosyltransferase family 2 protein n=1 Tax=Klenkia terrae TaxID=1052259 RepID=UPI003612B7F6
MTDLAERLTVVLLTHDCAPWLPHTLDRLADLGLPVVAVDNASADGTRELLAARPFVQLRALPTNTGAAGRNEGVRAALTPTSCSATTTAGGSGPGWSSPSRCWTPTPGSRWSTPGSWWGRSARRTRSPRRWPTARCRRPTASRARSCTASWAAPRWSGSRPTSRSAVTPRPSSSAARRRRWRTRCCGRAG